MFIGPKSKIERANQHISELRNLIEAFSKTDFYSFFVKRDPKSGLDVLHLQMKAEISPTAPLILGDAIHNLRATLDLMLCEMLCMAGRTPSKYAKFPFDSSRDQLKAAINGGEIKALGTAVIDLIVDTVKPYKGGNIPLYALHDLDIMDKHKLLIPVVNVSGVVGVHAHAERGPSFHNCSFLMVKGRETDFMATSGTNLKITDYGKPVFHVVFAEGQPFEKESVVPTLHQLTQLISGIVETFEKAYLATGKGR